MEVYKAFETYLTDYPVIFNRFDGMINIWEKYVLRFAKENSFELIRSAFREEEYKKAISYTHRLRGDALNLGFYTLAEAAGNLLKELNSEDRCNLQESFSEVEKIYNELQEIYKKLGQ